MSLLSPHAGSQGKQVGSVLHGPPGLQVEGRKDGVVHSTRRQFLLSVPPETISAPCA